MLRSAEDILMLLLLFIACFVGGLVTPIVAAMASQPILVVFSMGCFFVGARLPVFEGDKNVIDSTVEGQRFVPAFIVPLAVPCVLYVAVFILAYVALAFA